MRAFLVGFFSLIVILIIAIGVIAFIGWARVPDMLADNLSKKMKVSVSIADVNLGLSRIGVEGVEIGNPPRSILPKAFSAETIDINAPLTNYFSDYIIIDSIVIDNVYLGFEFDTARGTTGNWTTIMNNFSQASAPATKGEKKRKVLIKKLILTHISSELVYREGDQKIKKLRPISRLEFTNVTSEGGIPSDQIMKSVLGQTLREMFEKQNLNDMLQKLLQPQKGGPAQFFNPFQKLFK